MELKGQVHKFGDDINTDEIIPARYLNTSDPQELARHAMEDVDPEFVSKMQPGDFIVAGKNFGCGSSREQAASCLKGPDLIVIANDFARIFLQNSINLGLNTIICPGLEADEGDELEISATQVLNQVNGKSCQIVALPQARQAIIDAGGLIPYTRQRLLQTKK